MPRKVGNGFTYVGDSSTTQSAIRREVHTWAVRGEVKVPSGGNDYIPPMFISKASGETLTLLRIRSRINGGTSATVKMVRTTSGGSSTDLASGTSVTTTAGDSSAINQAMADNDMLRPEVTAVSATPVDMTITAVFERVG